MRWLGIGCACLALAGCGKAPEAGETASSAAGVAFAYRYDFRLPSSRVADAQERHARACEQLTPARCRITGMTYRLDGSGQAYASLDLQLAAPIARTFGRTGVRDVEAAGGALTGAEITGTDTAPAIAAARTEGADARDEAAEIDRQLARRDLPAVARTDLLARRAELLRLRRESATAAATARASVEVTPVSFTYAAGSGVGLAARLAEAGQAAYASLAWTLATILLLLAYLGPPLLVIVPVLWLWHRFGRRWWRRAFPHADPG